jgi:hypothetical protein
MKNTADVTGGKPIAFFLQSISHVSAIKPLVAFYDIHGGTREVLFFYFVPDTTQDHYLLHQLSDIFPIKRGFPLLIYKVIPVSLTLMLTQLHMRSCSLSCHIAY